LIRKTKNLGRPQSPRAWNKLELSELKELEDEGTFTIEETFEPSPQTATAEKLEENKQE
jgi:hypothetical protein